MRMLEESTYTCTHSIASSGFLFCKFWATASSELLVAAVWRKALRTTIHWRLGLDGFQNHETPDVHSDVK